jgi:UDP-glucose 4-epimerase
LVRQALNREPPTVSCTGTQIRCFCHVYDVIPGLIRLVQSAKAQGKAVGMGTSEPESIEDLASQVIAITGTDSQITRLSYEQVYGTSYEDILCSMPDSSLGGELIDFRPSRPSPTSSSRLSASS